jgi:hypothetical protein
VVAGSLTGDPRPSNSRRWPDQPIAVGGVAIMAS